MTNAEIKCNSDDLCQWNSAINECIGGNLYYPKYDSSEINKCITYCDNKEKTCGDHGKCNIDGSCTCDENIQKSLIVSLELISNNKYKVIFGNDIGIYPNTQIEWSEFKRIAINDMKIITDNGSGEIIHDITEISDYSNTENSTITFQNSIDYQSSLTLLTLNTGYWGGNNCNQCKEGYFGNDCRCNTETMCSNNGSCNPNIGCNCNTGWGNHQLLYNDNLSETINLGNIEWEGTTSYFGYVLANNYESISWRIKIKQTNENTKYSIGISNQKGNFNSNTSNKYQ